MMHRRETFRRRLQELGFDEVRFASAGKIPPLHSERFAKWLREGRQADMAWIDRSLEKRLDLEQVLPGADSVVLLGVNYLPETDHARDQQRWAKYSLYQDYHDTIRTALQQAGRFLKDEFGVSGGDYRYYVDTGPVMERGWAARSGLGWQGKNGMLISRQHGNWLFLAAIVTRLDFPPDDPLSGGRSTERDGPAVGLLCGTCTRCLTACPTGAIVEPGMVDSRLCISYQTIENKGIIPRDLREKIGTRLYGCDICLDVCPWNRFAKVGKQVLLAARFDIDELSLEEILGMDQETFSRVFAKTAIKRVKWRGLLRNACIVAGNLRDSRGAAESSEPEIERLRPLLIDLAAHSEPMVRLHAVWAVCRLWPKSARDWLATPRAGEADPEVLAEYAAWENSLASHPA